MRKAEISECELIVMKCVWDAGEPVVCSTVIEKLKKDYDIDYAETTVYTFLKNLKNKGFIDSYKKRITFFVPIVDFEEFRKKQVKKFIDFWFDGDKDKFISEVKKIYK